MSLHNPMPMLMRSCPFEPNFTELAYGVRGDGCLLGLDAHCRIPPNSPVKVTFVYKGLAY